MPLILAAVRLEPARLTSARWFPPADGGHARRPTDTAGGPAQLSARWRGVRPRAPTEPARDARALRPRTDVAGGGDRVRRRLARLQPRVPAERGRRIRRSRYQRSEERRVGKMVVRGWRW